MSNASDALKPKRAGCLKIVVSLSLLALIGIVLIPVAIVYIVRDVSLRLTFGRAARQGKFILFVYSDSPNWKTYIEDNLLSRIQCHATVLNWSQRKRWDTTSWPVRAFEHWGGREDFNPLAVVFCGLTKVRVLRFYRAFQDFKHGKEAPLRKVESELLELAEALTVIERGTRQS